MTTTFLDRKEQIAICLEDMFCKFGYTKYNMNRFEEYSFYMENEKFLDDSRVIVFNDPSGKLLALKPDITMSIIKNSLKSTAKNQKIYYNESVFRIPKGDSSYKEIKQIGVEFMGEIDDYQTIEILNLANKALAEISPNYVLCISNMTLILSIFDDLNLSFVTRNQILTYMSQKNLHDLQKFLTENNVPKAELFEKLLTINANIEKGIAELKDVFQNTRYMPEIKEITDILAIVKEVLPKDKVQLDFSYVTNTEYYNGLTFVGYIDGLAVPVLTGGRYDKLVSKMGNNDKNALGFAVDLSELDKFINDETIAVETINYTDETSVCQLIAKANQLYEEGKAFCFKK